MSFARLIVLATLGVATFACASATAVDADRAALLKTDQQWAAVASEARDIDAIVSYWADDATVYPENGPVIHGKAAIRQYVADSLKVPGFHITWKPISAVVSRSGDLGYTTDENAISLQVANGTIATFPGRGVTVWRKQNGQWKCVEDIWNSGSLPVSKSWSFRAAAGREESGRGRVGPFHRQIHAKFVIHDLFLRDIAVIA